MPGARWLRGLLAGAVLTPTCGSHRGEERWGDVLGVGFWLGVVEEGSGLPFELVMPR